MIQISSTETNKKWIPSNLPANQTKYWGKGIHFEEQNGNFHLDIEQFPQKTVLCQILDASWKNYINMGHIVVNTSQWRTRFTFTQFPTSIMNKDKILDIIVQEYNVVGLIAPIISTISSKKFSKVVSTQTTSIPVAAQKPSISNFRTTFSSLDAARKNNRILEKTALKNGYFTVRDFCLFRDSLSRYADKNIKKYPKHSDTRAWFVAEEIYKFLNSKGNYQLYKVRSTKTQKKNVAKTSTPKSTIVNSFKNKVMNHYGSSYSHVLYCKEFTYAKSHSGKCTWEDPNYQNYLNDLVLLKKIEQTNMPVREYMKKNMKPTWIDYEYNRKKNFMGKSNNSIQEKLEYAKFCSEYIKNLVSSNKIPSNVVRDWKYWVFIK